MSASPSTDTPLLPAPITSLKLSVTKGATTYEQPITSGLTHVTNNQYQVKITNTQLISAFNTEPHGTIFNPSIVVNYENEDFPSGNGVNFSSSLSYVPRQITPNFTFANIPDKTTSDSPFSVSGLITKDGTGAVSYTSSNQAVATIHPSTGLVTIVGQGTTTITATLAASADLVYTAVPPIQKTLVINPPPLISLLANNFTIKYNGDPSVDTSVTPLFIQANPRGTGTEWFAVVNDTSKSEITSYARNGTSSYFTQQGQSSPVIFNNIVTTLMTNMSSLFDEATTFDQYIRSWDTSNVTDMNYMFSGARAFNQPINSWNTSAVTNMSYMFNNAIEFNQPINSWNTSAVTNMDGMFVYAHKFNQPLNSWNTSAVTNMSSMFSYAYAFNQPLNSWNTSNVTEMYNMFYIAASFNQNISNWDPPAAQAPNPKVAGFRTNSQLSDDNTPPAIKALGY